MKLLIDIMNENFATKSDLKSEIKELEWRIEPRFQSLELKIQGVDSKLNEMEYRLIVKLGAMMATMITISIAVTTSLIKLLPGVGH